VHRRIFPKKPQKFFENFVQPGTARATSSCPEFPFSQSHKMGKVEDKICF
jgi:hypothetical protein